MRKQKQQINPYYQGPVSDHFDGLRFFLPNSVNPANSIGDLLRWQFSGEKQKWPKRVGPQPHKRKACMPCPARHDGDDFAITLIGHATVLLQTCGLNILTDPFFSNRASPFSFAGPKRVRPPALAINELPPIDIVLLSHNHFDHMDLPALAQIERLFSPRIITPLGNGAIIAKTGQRHDTTEVDWGDRTALNAQVQVTATPALHWSKRGLKDRNMALWAAFVIQTPFGAIYFAGDSGYGDGGHFRDVKNEFGAPLLSFLPIGAYEPRWFMKAQHMNPDEAVKAHLDLGAAQSIAIHHAAVQLTDEPIDAPAKALSAALDKYNIDPAQFRVLACGESLSGQRLICRA